MKHKEEKKVFIMKKILKLYKMFYRLHQGQPI